MRAGWNFQNTPPLTRARRRETFLKWSLLAPSPSSSFPALKRSLRCAPFHQREKIFHRCWITRNSRRSETGEDHTETIQPCCQVLISGNHLHRVQENGSQRWDAKQPDHIAILNRKSWGKSQSWSVGLTVDSNISLKGTIPCWWICNLTFEFSRKDASLE